MSTATIYELIGYAGSVLVVVSLAMSSIIRLRVINLLGAMTFALYGVLIGSLPVLLTNVIITGLDIWHLRKELTTREELKVIAVEINDPIVVEFIRFHLSDIRKFSTGFAPPSTPDVVFLTLRDVNPAGLFIGTALSDRGLKVDLDYVAPPYRDLRSGFALYGEAGERFSNLGWNSLLVENVAEKQRGYFEEMQFATDGSGTMVRTIGTDDDGP